MIKKTRYAFEIVEGARIASNWMRWWMSSKAERRRPARMMTSCRLALRGVPADPEGLPTCSGKMARRTHLASPLRATALERADAVPRKTIPASTAVTRDAEQGHSRIDNEFRADGEVEMERRPGPAATTSIRSWSRNCACIEGTLAIGAARRTDTIFLHKKALQWNVPCIPRGSVECPPRTHCSKTIAWSVPLEVHGGSHDHPTSCKNPRWRGRGRRTLGRASEKRGESRRILRARLAQISRSSERSTHPWVDNSRRPAGFEELRRVPIVSGPTSQLAAAPEGFSKS
jgi:hypothetical protein